MSMSDGEEALREIRLGEKSCRRCFGKGIVDVGDTGGAVTCPDCNGQGWKMPRTGMGPSGTDPITVHLKVRVPDSLDTFRKLIEEATKIRKKVDAKLAADLGDRHLGLLVHLKQSMDNDDEEWLTILVALREFVAIHKALSAWKP